eukprot:2427184-Alexandrium_andersonii.AAC.1
MMINACDGAHEGQPPLCGNTANDASKPGGELAVQHVLANVQQSKMKRSEHANLSIDMKCCEAAMR